MTIAPIPEPKVTHQWLDGKVEVRLLPEGTLELHNGERWVSVEGLLARAFQRLNEGLAR